ncbi:MAG TPA: FAD-dependent oxidoreductase [Longimicrobiales bacterium]|nr:FAD-dependent oxidoreductase [Longimicrobiales bacterium]
MSPLRRSSFWERDALPDPVSSHSPTSRTDVLIVGAGLMGRWLAYWLTAHGFGGRTLVVERDRFTYGASSRNAGFLTCGQVSEMLSDVESTGLDAVIETFEERRRGIELVRREFPGLEIDPCGSIDWDPLTPSKRDLAEELNSSAGLPVYTVRTASLAGREREVMFNRADGAVDPVDLLRGLARGTDAEFRFGVRAVRVADGSAVLESTEGIHELTYDRAFLCTNAFTSTLSPISDVRPGRGQIIVTSPVHTRTDRTLGYLNDGYDYFRFLGDRLLIGGGRHMHADRENGTTELKPTAEVGTYLKTVAAEVIGHDDFRVDHHWAGIMGFRGGRHLGGSPRHVVDARTEIVAGFGGMGVALTPTVAREVAVDVVEG